MKYYEYRSAIERLEPDPALKDAVEKAVLSQRTSAVGHRSARLAVGILAAVLLVVGSAGAALAASPELRSAVMSFLRIGGTEDVPGLNASTDSEPDISGAVIGGAVRTQYIKLDGEFDMAKDGLLCRTRVDPETGATVPVSFWNIEGNRAVDADVKVNRSEISVATDGVLFSGSFCWYERNGELSVFEPSRNLAPEAPGDVSASVSTIPGNTETVVVELTLDGRCKYFYYDLDTGKARDLFEGTDAEDMDDLKRADFAPDMSGALLERDDEWSYLDFKTGKASTLSELTGVGGFNMACLLNDGSVQMLKWFDAVGLGAGFVDCWLYDPADGSTAKVLDGERVFNEFNEPVPYGVVILGSYCLDVDEKGQVSVLDLKTGGSTVLEGFTYDPEATVSVSPDGEKILCAKYDDRPIMFVTSLTVLDMKNGVAVELDRVRPENLFELKCCWLDNDRVAVSGKAADGEGASLYVYDFRG